MVTGSFQGRDMDKSLFRDASNAARDHLGVQILIKRLTGSIPGNPSQGISPTYSFVTRKSRATITAIGQSDILKSGGLYQTGDITISINERLEEISDQTRGIGDHIIWEGNEYRVVGKFKTNTVTDQSPFFSYVMRKVE